jgi:[ribosomal protein S5]-alanine N-acetyltransferase
MAGVFDIGDPIGNDSLRVERKKTWLKTFQTGVVTDRLVLRSLQAHDFESWRLGYANRRPAAHHHDRGPVDASGLTEDKFSMWVERQAKVARRDQTYVFWLFTADMSTTVGAIDFSTLQRDNNAWANAGYVVHNQHQRGGYGREALRALLPVAFDTLGYHRIEAAIRPDNEPAIALARSVGLEFECVRKKFWLDPDGWADHVIYSITRP